MVGKSFSSVTKTKDSNRHSAGVGKWFKDTSNISYFPKNMAEWRDLNAFSKKYIFQGFGPDSPTLSPSDSVITMGSCFADRLREWLKSQGKNADYLSIPEGLNNTFALKQYLTWAFTGVRDEKAYWYKDADKIYEPEQEQKDVLNHFKNSKAVVVTFGLSEVWKDMETGGVFWRGVPANIYDPEKHKCVSTTVEENINNIKDICDLIHTYAGEDTEIVLTLSPVPLHAAFSNQPTIVADCASKCILRAALHEFLNGQNKDNIYYWPSFELVRWVGDHIPLQTLFEDKTPRHVNNQIVGIIINNFVQKFFKQS